MIVVMVMVLIFLSMVLTVVMLSTSATRRATAFQNRLIAFQVAEAGIQDALYWLNYGGYAGGQYPCTGPNATYDGSYKYFRGSDYTGTDSIWTNADPNTFTYTPAKEIPLGKCTLYFEDNTETDLDRIVSTGYYRGRTATITVNIRGQNGEGNALHGTSWRVLRDMGYVNGGWTNGTATWGTAEEFNKHALRANILTLTTPTVDGNVVYIDNGSSFPTAGRWTKTVSQYAIEANSMVRVDSSLYFPSDPTASAISATYSDTHVYATYPFYVDPDGAGAAPQATVYAADCFEFTNGDTINIPIAVNGKARFLGTSMAIDSYVRVNAAGAETGAVDIQGSARVRNFLDAAGAVTISGSAAIGGANGVCVKGSSIAITSATVTVDTSLLHSTGAITATITGNANPFTGVFFAEGGTSQFGTTANGLKLGTESSPIRIVIKNYASGVQLRGVTLFGTVFSQGAIGLYNGNKITAEKDTGIALAYDCAGGGSGTIVSDANTDYETGLVITRGNGNAIVLSNDQVKGALIADGTVSLFNGTVIWDAAQFKNTSAVYKNTKGGRRVYLPAPGSWSFR